MTIVLQTWMIPAAISVGLAAWAFLMPLPQEKGDFDFGPLLSGLFRLVVFVVGSLLSWVVYFIVHYW